MDSRRDGNRERTGRVIVGVDGSLGSLAAVRRAVAEARQRGAQLCAVRVASQAISWIGALGDDDLAVLHRQIEDAFRDARGEVPSDLERSSLAIVGAAGPALANFALLWMPLPPRRRPHPHPRRVSTAGAGRDRVP